MAQAGGASGPANTAYENAGSNVRRSAGSSLFRPSVELPTTCTRDERGRPTTPRRDDWLCKRSIGTPVGEPGGERKQVLHYNFVGMTYCEACDV